MKIVIDTCVLVSALRSRNGASFRVLARLPDGVYTPLVSVPVFLEYEAVLKRPENLARFGLSADDVDAVLDMVAARGERVRLDFLWRPALRDPDDEMFLELAVNGGAEALVTYNVRHFLPAIHRFGVALITPPMLLRHLEEPT